MGFNEILDTGGDAFYFPVIDDADTKAAQMELASLLISPEVQVEFNLAKGSLPVRGDIDMSSANACMQKGLNILAAGGIMPSNRQTFDADTDQQINDLMAEFWATDMPAEEAQASYVSIIKRAN
jgi:glucose/mannose transport system substrate-binding protein